jgi:hypothetical protein
MSKRSTILKIAGLDPIRKRTHICNAADVCNVSDCKHYRPHQPDEEECLIEDYCTELGLSCGGELCACVRCNGKQA